MPPVPHGRLDDSGSRALAGGSGYCFGTDLAGRVLLAVVRLNRRMRSRGANRTVSSTLLSALDTLRRHGALTPGRLAEYERIAPPTMTKIVAELEDAGLISRWAHPTDRRRAILGITQSGAELLAGEASAKEHWLTKRLAALTPSDRATLAEAAAILDRLSGD
ncbi:MAG TPA: MarR family transcriptional regulator [Pseudonocardia sp.]|uniref:MarR family winged helix-turn-helix transcriptional regulator n=1 Tax=Pseudonocardia sp. TaxID=60912 RepID=UPI002F3FBA1A